MRRILTGATMLCTVVATALFSAYPPGGNRANQGGNELAQVRAQDAREEAAAPKEHPSVTPRDTVTLSLADATVVAAAGDPHVPVEYVRYLSLHNYPSELRLKLKQTLNFTLNSLSKKRRIKRAAALPGNVPDPWLVRVNLLDYDIDPKDWDKLFDQGSGAVPIPESFYHVTLLYENKKIQAAAPWLLTTQEAKLLAAKAIKEEDTAIGRLIKLTNTRNPIGRADWFVYYAWVAPAYYELLGLPVVRGANINVALTAKLHDFFKVGRVDLDLAKASLVAGISDTKIVTLHNRVLQRYATVNGYTGGYMWISNDTDKGIDQFDYMLQLFTFDTPKVQAKEVILTLLNTLQAYALVNGDDVLINLAAANIAQHSNKEPTRLQDKQVYSGRNCVYCHREGIYPIKDNVRLLANKQIGLLIVDKAHGKTKTTAERWAWQSLSDKIYDAFDPSVENVVLHDQAIYTSAVAACNGLLPGANAAQLEMFHWTYYDSAYTIERVAWDAGWPVAMVEAALRTGINLDYTLTGLLQVPPVLPTILPWERQGYQQLMLLIIGVEALAFDRGTTVNDLLRPYMRKR